MVHQARLAAAMTVPTDARPEPAIGQSLHAGSAVGLANRLLDVEAQTLALRAELGRAQRELDNALAPGGGGGWFEAPKTRQSWPIAEQPEREPQSIEKYDRRPDDDVVIEGRRGESFMAAHALESATPNFHAAVAAINALTRCLDVVAADDPRNPDCSIIIPIYGQLGYTLNCIDSLFAHSSHHSAEIIIIDDRSPDVSGDFLPRLTHIRYHLQLKNGGFIASCNTGGMLARGRFVIMLNNDTRVVAGWLDGLIDSFTIFPRAGVVGSKLCYADGSLQEAGGIVWRDGSCWNYGRGDDPNRPQYAHARQVDYISGCAIAIPTDLWRELGGFDPHYAPAYCEDADLCLRTVALGREVWYQAHSRIIHYEGKTGGTDTSRGVKAYQVINNRKMYLRWREDLELHRVNGEAPYFERERSVRRRALIVDVTAPTPDQDAGSVQTVLGLQTFHELGYKTHFVPVDNWLFQPRYTTDLQRMGVECCYAPYDLGFTNYMRVYGKLFDVVLVYRMSVLERVLDDLRRYAPHAPILYHVADLHFLRRQREAELEGSAEGLAEAASLRRRELALVEAADCTITHSTVEQDILAAALPHAPVMIWPLMFEFHGSSIPFAARRDICFLGGYRHPPNVDAMVYFVREVLPLIRAADPSIRLVIAGANPTREIAALVGEGVDVVGMVADLRDVFDRCRVFICPLRVGAGVKGKILSALAYGLPIVSSSIGIEGSGLKAGEHAIVADAPADFAAATLRVYRDEILWRHLSTTGQAVLQAEFSVAKGRTYLSRAIAVAHRHHANVE